MAHIIENSADFMETAESLHNTLKLLETTQAKLEMLAAVLDSKDNSKLEYTLITQLPEIKALVNVCRDNVCETWNDMDKTYNVKLDDELEKM